MDHHVIVVGEDDVVKRAMHRPGVIAGRRLAEEVRPPDRTDEQ